MTDLEQLAALIELLDSPVHADAETHDSEHGACTECPVPLFSRPPLEIAQAIHDAGWTPPPAQTSGYTTHGHPIKGQVQSGKRPPIARCGGPRLCKQCAKEAAQ